MTLASRFHPEGPPHCPGSEVSPPGGPLSEVVEGRFQALLERDLRLPAKLTACLLRIADEQMIRTMLTKALGDDRAANLISRILSGGDTAGIEGLKWMDANTVADLIKNEHPQIIATILVHLLSLIHI